MLLPDIRSAKAQLRRETLARRDALDPAARAEAAEALTAHPLPGDYGPGAIVSGFVPIRTEINPIPLMQRIADRGASLALPAVVGRDQPLAMRAWSFGEPLVSGVWGLREPPETAQTVAPVVLLVPLAAFDRRGGRLGYGAGYYDRTIAELRASKRVTAIGVGFAIQEVEEVPVTERDQPLDYVLTEREVIQCERVPAGPVVLSYLPQTQG